MLVFVNPRPAGPHHRLVQVGFLPDLVGNVAGAQTAVVTVQIAFDAGDFALIDQTLQILPGLKSAGILFIVGITAVLIIFGRVDSFQTDTHFPHFQTVAVHHVNVLGGKGAGGIQAPGQQTNKQFHFLSLAGFVSFLSL